MNLFAFINPFCHEHDVKLLKSLNITIMSSITKFIKELISICEQNIIFIN